MSPLVIRMLFLGMCLTRKVFEIIYEITFYAPLDWLKNNQSWAAISTSAIPPHVHAFFKLTDLLPFDTNDVTRNLNC